MESIGLLWTQMMTSMDKSIVKKLSMDESPVMILLVTVGKAMIDIIKTETYEMRLLSFLFPIRRNLLTPVWRSIRTESDYNLRSIKKHKMKQNSGLG